MDSTDPDFEEPREYSAADWRRLDLLRSGFLEARPTSRAYWETRRDLELYDATFAQRIGWKWDAIFKEIADRRWSPPRLPWVDFGCGSGIVSRKVLASLPSGSVPSIHLIDRSPLAVGYAMDRLRALHPSLSVQPLPMTAQPDSTPDLAHGYVLAISHVWNELDPHGQSTLLNWMRKATAIVWVEPGTHAMGRAVQTVRDQLKSAFHVIAPCTHQAACGLLALGQEAHWCHHFAEPPPHVFQSRNWARMATQLGIDLRALPYSFLILDAIKLSPQKNDTPTIRIIGRPQVFKPYVRLMGCSEEGVGPMEISKRENPDFHHACRKGTSGKYL